MSKKQHYHNDLGYEAKPHLSIKKEKSIKIHKLELFKAVCKIGVGVAIIGPLNAPYGFLPVILGSIIWASYVALEYTIKEIKTSWDSKVHWIY